MEVINGVVWGKNFFVELSVSGNIFKGDYYGYGLLASAGTVWRTAEFNRYYSAGHLDYIVGHPGGCEGCVSVYSKFTPFTDPAVVRGLMDFNLDCLTRFVQCRVAIDIMPSVWKQVMAEDVTLEAARKNNSGLRYTPTPSPLFLGRDRDNVVIAEVASTRTEEHDGRLETFATFRLDRRLKRSGFWKDFAFGERYSATGTSSIGNGDAGELITPGRKLILAFDSPTPYELGTNQRLELGDYDALSLTDENLAAVRKGISLDIFPPKTYQFP